MRVRVFIDYWNLQLAWNERANGAPLDWPKVPLVFCHEVSQVLQKAMLGSARLEETRVYGGYEAGREAKLKRWFDNYLDRQPGFRVFTSERHWKARPVHCRACNSQLKQCPNCNENLGRAAEKTVDARIVSDLISLAWEQAYDAAILVTSDKDFIPAVECVQRKNFKVINATWRGLGHELARVCWTSFEIDPLIERLKRTG